MDASVEKQNFGREHIFLQGLFLDIENYKGEILGWLNGGDERSDEEKRSLSQRLHILTNSAQRVQKILSNETFENHKTHCLHAFQQRLQSLTQGTVSFSEVDVEETFFMFLSLYEFYGSTKAGEQAIQDIYSLFNFFDYYKNWYSKDTLSGNLEYDKEIYAQYRENQLSPFPHKVGIVGNETSRSGEKKATFFGEQIHLHFLIGEGKEIIVYSILENHIPEHVNHNSQGDVRGFQFVIKGETPIFGGDKTFPLKNKNDENAYKQAMIQFSFQFLEKYGKMTEQNLS